MSTSETDISGTLLSISLLAIVGETRSVSLHNGDAVKRVAFMFKRLIQVIENEHGNMLRRRVQLSKLLHLVEISMVKSVHNLLDLPLQHLEIDSHADIVKLCSSYGYLHLPVMAMGQFTISRIVTQMMGTGKVGLYKYIEHAFSLIQNGGGRALGDVIKTSDEYTV